MKKRIGLVLAAMLLAIPAWGQYTPPSAGAYTYSGASWSAALSSYGGQALSYAPPSIALYCLNTTLNQWVPWTSACTNGGTAGTVTLTSKADNANYYLTFVAANSSTSQGVDVGPATYNPSTNTSNVNTTGKAATVDSLASLTNGASPVNMSAPGLTVNAVADPTGTTTSSGATSGGTVGVSSYNYAVVWGVDSGGNVTQATNPSIAIATTSGNQTIPWAWTAISGLPSGAKYAIGTCQGSSCTPNMCFYSTTNSYTQSAASSTGTSCTVPTANTTGQTVIGPALIMDASGTTVAAKTTVSLQSRIGVPGYTYYKLQILDNAALGNFLHNYFDPTSNGHNTFAGMSAGNFTMGPSGGANQLGSYNSGFGAFAITANTTGYANSCIGVRCLEFNTTGFDNSGVGLHAHYGNTTGNDNTAIGAYTLNDNTTGSYNTAVGSQAGATETAANTNVSGSYNVWVGYNSGPGTPTQLTNSIGIGYDAHPTASNQAVIGNAAITVFYLGSNLVAGMAYQAANSVNITGGTVNGVTTTGIPMPTCVAVTTIDTPCMSEITNVNLLSVAVTPIFTTATIGTARFHGTRFEIEQTSDPATGLSGALAFRIGVASYYYDLAYYVIGLTAYTAFNSGAKYSTIGSSLPVFTNSSSNYPSLSIAANTAIALDITTAWTGTGTMTGTLRVWGYYE